MDQGTFGKVRTGERLIMRKAVASFCNVLVKMKKKLTGLPPTNASPFPSASFETTHGVVP